MPGSRQGGGENQPNEYGGFFNELVTGDRVAEDVLLNFMMLGHVHSAGVAREATPGTNLAVSATSPESMQVNVAAGQAFLGIPGYMHGYVLSSPRALVIEQAHPTANRIDVVGVHMDASSGERKCTLEVLKGTPAVAGTTRTDTSWAEDTTGNVQFAYSDMSFNAPGTYDTATWYSTEQMLPANAIRYLYARKRVSDTTPLADYRLALTSGVPSIYFATTFLSHGAEWERVPASLRPPDDGTTYLYYRSLLPFANVGSWSVDVEKATRTSVTVPANAPAVAPMHTASQSQNSYWLELAYINLLAGDTNIRAGRIADRRVAARSSALYITENELAPAVQTKLNAGGFEPTRLGAEDIAISLPSDGAPYSLPSVIVPTDASWIAISASDQSDYKWFNAAEFRALATNLAYNNKLASNSLSFIAVVPDGRDVPSINVRLRIGRLATNQMTILLDKWTGTLTSNTYIGKVNVFYI